MQRQLSPSSKTPRGRRPGHRRRHGTCRKPAGQHRGQRACSAQRRLPHRLRLDVLRGRPPADCAKADADPILPPLPAPRPSSDWPPAQPRHAAGPAPRRGRLPLVRAAAQAARAQLQAWAARWPALSLVGNIGWSAAQTGDLFKQQPGPATSAPRSTGGGWFLPTQGRGRCRPRRLRGCGGRSRAGQLVALQDAQASPRYRA